MSQPSPQRTDSTTSTANATTTGETPNLNVLILGEGTIAQELANSYRHLGLNPVVGSVQDAVTVRPAAVIKTDRPVAVEDLKAVEGETGAVVVPSISACEMTANRAATRTMATNELGLPTLEHEFVRTPAELEAAIERIGYPCVFKPWHSSDGVGQTVIRSAQDLAEAWGAARAAEDTDGGVVERFIAADQEITIITARSIDPATGKMATWFCEPIGTRHEKGRLVEAWQPAVVSEAAMDNARSIAARITGALDCCGVFAIELFVDGEEVYFSQVIPRPSRLGMVTRATQRLNQFDLHARATIHLPIDVTLVTPGAAVFVPLAGSVVARDRLAAAMSVEETGLQVLGDGAVVMSTGDTVEEARERAARAAACLVGE